MSSNEYQRCSFHDELRSAKIYILRHGERDNSIGFDTLLTPRGIQHAEKEICLVLQKIKFDEIYCSPFLRTLQTIKPYCDLTGSKVNLEWALSESIPEDYYIPQEYNDIINHDYQSYYVSETSTFLADESFENIKNRIRDFIQSRRRNISMLFVTHLPIINAIVALRGLEETVQIFTKRPPGSLLAISSDKISTDLSDDLSDISDLSDLSELSDLSDEIIQ